jgi:HAE1 family hydrophobic/amphiphilic exporter-1/multidrug efflux pump
VGSVLLFHEKGKQYQVIGQFDQKIVQTIGFLSMYVKNNKGELIQMDNIIVVSTEQK